MTEKEDIKKNPLSLKEYQELQKDEILGADNKYFAGQELGHPPTAEEAAEHYVTHGGPEHFAQEHLLKDRTEEEPPLDKKQN